MHYVPPASVGIQLSDPYTWPRKYRRVYLALWPVAMPLHAIATVAGFLCVGIVLCAACVIAAPLIWGYDMAREAIEEAKFQWNRE